ncbi:MAG TPA: DUF481 domain-containing protein, partial [Rhodocyclaceae bacterium]|nr:DUF481 domain-containing protein [Rhodocyclaceae bacterium]
MPIQRFLSLSLSLALLGSGTAMADQVILKNGDIISGTVVSKSGDTLTFNTPYAGDIKIAWNEISTLSTDKPVNALFTDDSYVRTSLLPAGRGNVRLQSTRPATVESDEDGNVDADAPSVAANADAGEGKPAVTMADANSDDRALGLNDILYLNPTPEESGRGYRYSARANLASSNTSGNSSNQQLHMDGELQKRARDYRYTLGGEGNRASDSDVTSVSNWRTYASYDSFYTPTDFVYIHGALENDKFKDIKLRSVAGV